MTTHIDPRTAPHHIAVAARDAAVLDALETYFPTGDITSRAIALSDALRAYKASTYWPAMRGRREPPEGASPRTAALHRIVFLDRGRTLEKQSIRRIAQR